MNRVASEIPKESDENHINSVKLGTHFCRRSVALLGKPIHGRISFLFLVYSMAVLICCLQMIVFLIVSSDSFELRFKALENINLTVLCFFILLEFGLYPEKTQILMDIIDDSISVLKYEMPLSENMKRVKLEACKKDVSIQNQFSSLIFIYYFITFFIPVIYSIFAVLFTSDVHVHELPLIYVYWLPIPMDNVVVFFMQLLIQSLHGIVLCVGYIGWFVLFITAVVHTQHEVQILCHYLHEMDDRLNPSDNCREKILPQSLAQEKGPFPDELLNELLEEQNRRLKFYLNQICGHHIAIIRTVRAFNENCSTMLYVYNQVVVFELCIHMFSYFRSDGVERYQHLITALVILLLISNIGNIGQGLIDEGDKLIEALSQCSWIDKPTWFKKSLRLMIMTATHKPLQIQPIGLFVINLQYVSKVIQAAYSYLNVMRTVKD